uniref:Hz18-like protein n=1 Tax=Ampelophaga rubiginosa nucleopolyhedrovirus TaxID=512493 RepID=B3TZ24_9ABAC|nr:Hz18-like protein [Ampelophaga rubiginosa nucleopolyhedrovirus]
MSDNCGGSGVNRRFNMTALKQSLLTKHSVPPQLQYVELRIKNMLNKRIFDRFVPHVYLVTLNKQCVFKSCEQFKDSEQPNGATYTTDGKLKYYLVDVCPVNCEDNLNELSHIYCVYRTRNLKWLEENKENIPV